LTGGMGNAKMNIMATKRKRKKVYNPSPIFALRLPEKLLEALETKVAKKEIADFIRQAVGQALDLKPEQYTLPHGRPRKPETTRPYRGQVYSAPSIAS
jgi:hypothetical protein